MLAVLLVALGLPASAASAAHLTESFDAFPPMGWTIQNNSSPVGGSSWFQGNTTVFEAYDGAPNAYIAANFNNTTANGTISTWLITPPLTGLTQGDTVSFYTRRPPQLGGAEYPDRLELRISTNGTCNPGSGATGVGSFTTLLLSINPTLTTGVYPSGWTQYEATLPVMPPAAGCVAFRYYVTDAGPNAVNSDYVGIDRVEITDRPDSVEPETGIASGPSGATRSNEAIFVYSGTPAAGVAAYECRLVATGHAAPAFADCPAVGRVFGGLADGEYTFEVRAVSHGGNPDPTPATRTFTVDTTPPDTSISTGPSGVQADDDASFTYEGTPADDVDRVECRLRSAADEDPAFADCPSTGQGYDTLADGDYVFEVRAVDAVDNADPTPDSRAFTVDRSAPTVTISAGPEAVGTTTTATFVYAATPEDDVDAVECRLIGPHATEPAFVACPATGTTFEGLAVGEYRFEVRAVDAVGNASDPAIRSFRIDAPPPPTDPNPPTDPPPPTDPNPPTDPPAPFVPRVPARGLPIAPPGPSAFPAVGGLRLERTSFRAARSGPAFAIGGSGSGGRGTVLRLEPDRTVRVELRISRRVARRWQPLRGVVRMTAVRGVTRIRVRGRFRGVTLRPGRYRLGVTVVDAASGVKANELRQFRIRR